MPVVGSSLIIDRQKVSGGEAVLQRAVIRFDGQPNPTLELVEHRPECCPLEIVKITVIGWSCGDHNQAGGVSRLHEVP